MPDIKVIKDAHGRYILSHPSGHTQVMDPEHAEALGVRGMFESHLKKSKPEPVKLFDGGTVGPPLPSEQSASGGMPPAPSGPDASMFSDPTYFGAGDPTAALKGLGGVISDGVKSGYDFLSGGYLNPPAPTPATTQTVAQNGPLQQGEAPGAGEAGTPATQAGGQAGAPMFAPPQMTTTGVQTTSGKALPQANIKAIQNATGEQKSAVDAQAKVQGELGADKAGLIADTIENAQNADSQIAKNEEARKAELEERVNAYKTAVDNYVKTPNQTFWEKKGTGARVMGGIAMALGALGAGMTHGPNFAMDIINKAIDDDLNHQKLELEKQGQNVRNNESLLGQMRLKFGDERQAEIAAKSAMLKNAELTMQGIAAKYQGPEAVANAQATKAGFAQAQADLLGKYAVEAQPTTTTTKQLMSAPGTPTPEQLVDMPDTVADGKGGLVPGSGGRAYLKNPKFAEKVADHNRVWGEMNQAITELEYINKTYGKGVLPSGVRKRAIQLSNQLNQQSIEIQDMKKWTDGERDNFKSSLLPDDPTSWANLNVDAQISGMRKSLNSAGKNFNRSYGVIPFGNGGGLPTNASQFQQASVVPRKR